MLAHDMARAQDGTFLLRIEDIDLSRARPHWEAQIHDDLGWLGITWDAPPLRQSQQMDRYARALDTLWARGLLYPCSCTRRDIQNSASAPQEGAGHGPDGLIYPGTCREHPRTGRRPDGTALRLDMARAAGPLGRVHFTETGTRSGVHAAGAAQLATVGDVVLARRDMGTSYHLSAVLDDAAQGITHVIRGEDLFDATVIHVVLQGVFGLPTPAYHHHRLIRDDRGKRLAKRDDARALSRYRAEGATPDDIRRMVGLE